MVVRIQLLPCASCWVCLSCFSRVLSGAPAARLGLQRAGSSKWWHLVSWGMGTPYLVITGKPGLGDRCFRDSGPDHCPSQTGESQHLLSPRAVSAGNRAVTVLPPSAHTVSLLVPRQYPRHLPRSQVDQGLGGEAGRDGPAGPCLLGTPVLSAWPSSAARRSVQVK